MENNSFYLKHLESLLEIKDTTNIPVDELMNMLGQIVDLSLDFKRIDGLDYAITQLDILKDTKEINDEYYPVLHYFLSNAWSNKGVLLRQQNAFEGDEYLEKEIINIRSAALKIEHSTIPSLLKCSILTNLGNLFLNIGRYVESLDYYNRAISINPEFGMALGNKGRALFYYGKSLYDQGHASAFLHYAHINLQKSVKSIHTHDVAKQEFMSYIQIIESSISQEHLEEKVFDNGDNYPLGDTKEEVAYRKWCLDKRLFLNPLNDISTQSIAAQDIFNLPTITTSVDEGPHLLGFFNQMKQEYASARYLFYEAINSKKPHFSDKDVYLYDTMDYPVYSFATEKLKISYRMMYSIFDKTAFFINDYLELGIDERRVNFRTIWYTSSQKGIKQNIRELDNWSLRGLFWLSKDLFVKYSDFTEVIEPEARDLSEIRNHVEHKYMKIHEFIPMSKSNNNINNSDPYYDRLSFSMSKKEFEQKLLKITKLARSALMYLSLFVNREEYNRNSKKVNKGYTMPMNLNQYNKY